MKKFAALLLAFMISGGLTFAQDFYDDIYYDSSKEKEVKEKKKEVEYIEEDEFSGTKYEDYGGGRDVDEYNRRGGIYASPDTLSKSKKSESDGQVFEYTERIERFDNPDIVKGSDDEDLKTLYYAGDVNIYVGNPSNIYTFDDFGFALGYLAGSSSSWYWNYPYYSPYYNWRYWDPWFYMNSWYDPFWGTGYWYGHHHHCWYPGHYYPHYHPGYYRPVHHHRYTAGGRSNFGGVSGYHYGNKGRVNKVNGIYNGNRNNIRRPNKSWNRGENVGTSGSGNRNYNGYRGGGNSYRGDDRNSINRENRYNSNRNDRFNSDLGDRFNSNRGDRFQNNRTDYNNRPSRIDNNRGSGYRGGSSIGNRGSYGGGRGSFGGGSSSGHRGGRR